MINKLFSLIAISLLILSCDTTSSNPQFKLELVLNTFSHDNEMIEIDTINLYIISDNVDEQVVFDDFFNSQILFTEYFIKQNFNVKMVITTAGGINYEGSTELELNNDTTLVCKLEEIGSSLIITFENSDTAHIDVNSLLDFSIDDKYYHKYIIENVNEIKEQYVDSDMIFLLRFGVNYDILDSNMIPLIEYDFGTYRNPVSTCHTALGFYHYFIQYDDDIYKEWFLNNADWLIENSDPNGYLHYEFDWNHYSCSLETGWISGMSQGEALAVMSRAYRITGDIKYLSQAELYFSRLKNNTGDYWCVGIDSNNYYLIEEYPNEDFCHVFNGMLFSNWGLWDYYCISDDEDALDMFEGIIKSVINNNAFWKCPDEFGSSYCKHSDSKTHYHDVHIDQLEKYQSTFNIEEFGDLIQLFNSTIEGTK